MVGLDSADVRKAADHSLEELYRKHWMAVRAYVRRNFGAGPPDPDDIAQEAFMRLADRSSAQDVSNPKAFLMVTARHLAIDARRRLVTGGAVVRTLGLVSENRDEMDASDVLSSKQELERLAAVVETLKPKERAVFLMRRVDGLSFVEIARRMGISESGARALADRALATCVARLRK